MTAQAPTQTTYSDSKPARMSVFGIFVAFLKLGCTSFGGPIAHLGYFRAEFVERRKWVSDDVFGEIVALAQSMPGPASSQVGFALGLLRGGAWGGLAAWLGFTLPSALLMLAFAVGHEEYNGVGAQAVLHGLQLVAVAVIAQAILRMQRSLAPDNRRLTIAVIATAIVLFAPATQGTLLAIAFGVVAGIILLRSNEQQIAVSFGEGVSRKAGAIAAAVFVALLVTSAFLQSSAINSGSVFTRFYRAGALVFGGGHVVLPLLDEATVAKGWISAQGFLSGYGAAQALPGPLFTFAAYLGTAIRPNPHALLLGVEALVSIFLPGLLIMTAVLPFWNVLRQGSTIQFALKGINASVVGVLIAALYQPVWTSTVHTGFDFWVALSAFVLLTVGKVQPWIVVLSSGTVCGLLGQVGS